jgi:hypothetical protein
MTTIEQNQNSARRKKPAPSPWKLRQRLATATLVTSNLLILAASNVLFPAQGTSAAVTLCHPGTRLGPQQGR